MRYVFSTDKTVPLTLCEDDTAMSVLQQCALVCSTKKGTCPGYRDFGIPMNFVGRPTEVAETIAVQEIQDALTEFVPDAEFIGATISGNAIGDLNITVEVDI